MATLANLGNIPKLLTQAEIDGTLLQRRGPCAICGSSLFSITARGEWVCWGCDYDRAHADRGIVKRVQILLVDGQPTVCDYDAMCLDDQRQGAVIVFGAQIIHTGPRKGRIEWLSWNSDRWQYIHHTWGLPVETLELWVRRTRRLTPVFNPDMEDFCCGTVPPTCHSGIDGAWWPVEPDT